MEIVAEGEKNTPDIKLKIKYKVTSQGCELLQADIVGSLESFDKKKKKVVGAGASLVDKLDPGKEEATFDLGKKSEFCAHVKNALKKEGLEGLQYSVTVTATCLCARDQKIIEDSKHASVGLNKLKEVCDIQ